MRANNTLVYVCFFLCYCCSIRFQRALFGKGKNSQGSGKDLVGGRAVGRQRVVV